MNRITLVTLSLAFMSIVSCKKNDDDTLAGTFKSAEKTMGNGKVYSWVKKNDQGKPVSIGFTLTAAALENLPDTGDHGGGHTHENSVELQMPDHDGQTPFKHISIDWNPAGHEPAPIYGLPHFDFHFYTISSADRMLIPPYEVDSAKFKNFPGADYLPAGYFNPGGGVPMMGAHWSDPTSPELNGEIFDETFIYGTYDGMVNFIEPMITYDYFKAITNFERSIPRPAKVKVSGYYPKTLRIVKADGQYTVALEDMEYRTGE